MFDLLVHFEAPKYLMDQRSNASGGQEVSVKDKKDTRCKSWATSRGKRDLQDITIETYENDDNSASLVICLKKFIASHSGMCLY